MKLYYSKGACSLAVRIVVNELKISSCEFESVDLKTKKTQTGADFLQVNPKGSVPALVLEDGGVLTENAVIQQYLAEKHTAVSLLPPLGDMNRYRVLEWLNYISTEVHKCCSPFFNPRVTPEARETIFKPMLFQKLKFVNRHLKEKEYLLDQQFTLADAYLFVVLSWLKHIKIELSEWSDLLRYYQTLKQRASIQKSFKDEGLEG